MKRKIRTAYNDPDPPSTPHQSTHHMPYRQRPEPPNTVTSRPVFTNSSAMGLTLVTKLDFVPGFDGRAEFQQPGT